MGALFSAFKLPNSGFGAEFGPWPEMTIEKAAQIFVWGTEFEGVPNGSRFFLGSPAPAAAE